MKPSVGRIVHFRRFDKCYAAIITDVNVEQPSPHMGLEPVQLTVFPDCTSIKPIAHGESKSNGTWHWPERVEE
jgi:hypothetical protein